MPMIKAWSVVTAAVLTLAAAAGAEPGPAAPAGPLTPAEEALQGTWQAYDYGTTYRTWLMEITGRRFRAEGGTDDWYEGRIVLGDEMSPRPLDFAIEDCPGCIYKGESSLAIYRWEGEDLVVSAPSPGSPRPTTFVESSGQMMRLERVDPQE